MRMTSMSVCPGTVTLERLNIFESRFQHPTYGVICRLKFVFISKLNVPFGSSVKVNIHFKYGPIMCGIIRKVF
jgi:hypothetical protein